MRNKTLNMLLIALIVLLGGGNKAGASLLQLTHDPLFLSQTVPPSLAVTFDDSGSMAWGNMGPARALGYDSRAFADPTLNKVYYNPNIVYRPPIGADGVELPQSDFNNAKIDGFDFRTNAPRVNLSQNFIPIAYNYFYSQGSYSFRFAQIPNTQGVDTVYTNAWSYYPNAATRNATGRAAFYYIGNTLVDVPASQQNNFANWYTYYSNRLKMGKTAVSRAFATFGPNFKISWQQLNNNTTFPNLNKFELTHRNDFFKWLFNVPSNGNTPLRAAFNRAGQLFTQKSSYYSQDFGSHLTCQQNFHIALSDGEWNRSFSATVDQDETSFTNGLPGDTANLYGSYTGNGEQNIYPKSESGSTLSDIAFHYWANDLMPLMRNNVKRFKGDYTKSDGTVIVPAGDDWEEEAFVWNPKNDPAYWQHMVTYNIGMGLEASRVVDYIDTTTDSNPNTNPICPQIPGLSDPKEIVYRGLRSGSCNWPNATNALNKVDDVWHSSINSRGDFFSANDPEELTAALNNVVNSILERLSRGSTSTVSSGVITSATKAYSPGFDSSNWTGNLLSRPVNRDGSFGEPDWDLSCKLTGGYCEATQNDEAKQADRRVFTINTNNGNRVRFRDGVSGNVLNRFNENSLDLRNRLNVTTSDLINYLLGDQNGEIQNNGFLRNRESILADIVHSSPKVQRGPSARYLDKYWPVNSEEYLTQPFDSNDGIGSYEQYKIDNKDRRNLVYIGSNTGMLHAVNVNNGSERWAYIPSKAFDNIHRLADPLYNHWSYVDNSPIIGDAFFNSQWNTVLISGLRYGGQAYFALNVSNTDATRPEILWEFTDENDADMGYSYGQATIARIASINKWVALIPNGYNNSQKDFPSLPNTDPKNRIGDGSAVLYVVDISNGDLIAKLDTNVGTPTTPNGMAPATAVVSKFISKHSEVGADFAYAGDLYGNLWRFDLTSPDPNDWESTSSIHKVLEAQGIMEQPITVKPSVMGFSGEGHSSERDVMVLIASGKYIEIPDRSINLPRPQFMAGILDGLHRTDTIKISSTNLIKQTMEVASNFRPHGAYNTVDYSNGNVRGWKINLGLGSSGDTTGLQGERVANPILTFGTQLALFSSIIPGGSDPCESGGESWLLAVNPMTGYKPEFGDLFDGGSGLKITGVIVGEPPIVECEGGGCIRIITETNDDTTPTPPGGGNSGNNGVNIIDLKNFTWRRRGWENLLTY